jgi:hypothetical protein
MFIAQENLEIVWIFNLNILEFAGTRHENSVSGEKGLGTNNFVWSILLALNEIVTPIQIFCELFCDTSSKVTHLRVECAVRFSFILFWMLLLAKQN